MYLIDVLGMFWCDGDCVVVFVVFDVIVIYGVNDCV